MTGLFKFEIIVIPKSVRLTTQFPYFIFKGLIVGVKHYLRNAANYLSFSLVRVFILQPIVLVCVLVVSGQAASDIGYDDNHISYRLNHKPDLIPNGVNLLLDDPYLSILRAQSENPIKDESPLGEEEIPNKKKETIEPITRKLPIWGEKIREMGFDLPLPFGVGANFVYMDQGIEIRNLKIDTGNTNFDISGVAFSDARAHDAATTARLDLWLLPFANVYGIFGYINGEAELDVNFPAIIVDLPVVGPTPITDATSTNFNIDYNGTTFGGGVTLAGGYKDFFGSLDINYTHSNVDVLDGEIKTLTVSPRLGVLVDPAAIRGSLAFWVGAMYMDYKQTVTNDINLREIDPSLPSVEIDFKIDLKNEERWNFLFGGQWEITKRWQVMAEGGLGNRRQLILGAFFRF